MGCGGDGQAHPLSLESPLPLPALEHGAWGTLEGVPRQLGRPPPSPERERGALSCKAVFVVCVLENAMRRGRGDLVEGSGVWVCIWLWGPQDEGIPPHTHTHRAVLQKSTSFFLIVGEDFGMGAAPGSPTGIGRERGKRGTLEGNLVGAFRGAEMEVHCAPVVSGVGGTSGEAPKTQLPFPRRGGEWQDYSD